MAYHRLCSDEEVEKFKSLTPPSPHEFDMKRYIIISTCTIKVTLFIIIMYVLFS